MKIIKILIILLIAIIAITIATANGQDVTLMIMPEWMPIFSGLSFTAPLFVFIYAAIFAGILLGLLYENLRGFGVRRTASKAKREVVKKDKEIQKLKKESGRHDDDVLAILD